MKIEVTQEDIEKGFASCPFSCPVALAIHRQAKQDTCVGASTASVGVRQLDLPSIAIAFINDFDFGGVEVKPFTFDLEIAAIHPTQKTLEK